MIQIQSTGDAVLDTNSIHALFGRCYKINPRPLTGGYKIKPEHDKWSAKAMTNLVLSAGGKIPRLYEKMQTAIAACHSFDEVKAIADQAAAIAAYHKQIRDDASMRRFLEIKLRAWRRIGEIIGGRHPPCAVLRRPLFSCDEARCSRLCSAGAAGGSCFSLSAAA